MISKQHQAARGQRLLEALHRGPITDVGTGCDYCIISYNIFCVSNLTWQQSPEAPGPLYHLGCRCRSGLVDRGQRGVNNAAARVRVRVRFTKYRA